MRSPSPFLSWLKASLLVWLVTFASASGAITPISIGNQSNVNFTEAAEIFIDVSGQLGPEDVVALAAEFRPLRADEQEKIYDERPIWLRARLHNTTSAPIERWLVLDKTRIESVTLYQATANGWSRTTSGMSVPQKDKPINTTGVVLPIELAAREQRDVLLRIQSRTILDLGVKVWKIVDFLQKRENRLQIESIAMGGTLIAALVSLTLFIYSRQSSYLLFAAVHTFSTYVTFSSKGLWERFFWPAHMAMPIELHLLAGTMGVISLIFFQRNILDLARNDPRMNKVLMLLAGAFALLIPCCMFNYLLGVTLFTQMIALSFPVVMYIAIRAWRQGNAASGYLVLAYGLIWITGTLRASAFMGLYTFSFAEDISITWALLVATPLMVLTLIKQANTLNAQLSDSHALTRTKQALLAKVSHDLRAPLNTIIGYAHLLARDSARLSLQQGIAGIERSGMRLLDLIEDLLDQSQLEAKRLALNIQPLALKPWLEDLERDSQLLAESNNNTFILKATSTLPQGVRVDAARLRQIIDNLLSNANRHTRQGQIELHFTAETMHKSDKMRLTFAVVDNGEGIEASALENIFASFYKGTATPNHSGQRASRLGLGLSIARDLTRLMGAELTVTSKIGAGTTFSFQIEVECVSISNAAPAGTAAPRGLLFRGESTLRILAADDNADDLHLLIEQLHSIGLHAHGVNSGQALIAALDKNCWDMVITDQTMPHGDGWSVLRFVRAHYPALPVILVSSTTPEHPADLPTGCHFDVFISKPYKVSTLVQSVLPWIKRTAKTSPGALSPLLNKPAQRQIEELAALVRSGHITAILQWCSALSHQEPELAPYASAVQQATQQLDFEQLKALVGYG